jgi:hypothetical protein
MTPSPEDEILEIPNANYAFLREAPKPIRSRFAWTPSKMAFSAGTPLYRFVEGNLRGAEYEFWLPLETYLHLWRAGHVPAWAVWNNGDSAPRAPTCFWLANLTGYFYGFKGLAAANSPASITPQSLNAGGLVWIPGLAPDQLHLKVFQIGFHP